MSKTPPPLTDYAALARNRLRANEEGMFLQNAALDEIKDRLDVVNRSFNSKTIVTGWPNIWSGEFEDADLINDADQLDLAPKTSDLVIHAMSLHWANDPVGQLIQARRALKPDGLFLGIFFGGQTLHELRACLSEAEISVSGGLSPRVLPMADIRDLGGLMQRAQFTMPVVDVMTLNVEYDDVWHLMRDVRGMGEGNALFDRNRMIPSRRLFETTQQLYQRNFPGKTKAINATFELMIMTGWEHSDSQPKALRPGSAKMRLAEALGTGETKLPD